MTMTADTTRLLRRLNAAWQSLVSSYEDMPPDRLLVPGVTGRWSVKDIIAHVSTWEEEALKHLPAVAEGRRPPRYSVTYGGIDAFNALTSEAKRGLSLAEVLRQRDDIHGRLVAYVESVPDELLAAETRFRRRLRNDTYGHYPKHARRLREWRNGSPTAGG